MTKLVDLQKILTAIRKAGKVRSHPGRDREFHLSCLELEKHRAIRRQTEDQTSILWVPIEK